MIPCNTRDIGLCDSLPPCHLLIMDGKLSNIFTTECLSTLRASPLSLFAKLISKLESNGCLDYNIVREVYTTLPWHVRKYLEAKGEQRRLENSWYKLIAKRIKKPWMLVGLRSSSRTITHFHLGYGQKSSRVWSKWSGSESSALSWLKSLNEGMIN